MINRSWRPRLLDLCCGAGLAADGYHRAGFEVVGIDIKPHPNYPFEFHQLDALDALTNYIEEGDGSFAAIHASFPCQRWTAYARRGAGVGDGYPDLVTPGRELLERTGLPYVIENVKGAPLRNPIMLCGSSFGLDVQRHRFFESNVPMMAAPCNHSWQTPRFPAATNRKANSRRTVEVGVYRIPLATQKCAMGVDRTVTLGELSEGASRLRSLSTSAGSSCVPCSRMHPRRLPPDVQQKQVAIHGPRLGIPRAANRRLRPPVRADRADRLHRLA